MHNYATNHLRMVKMSLFIPLQHVGYYELQI